MSPGSLRMADLVASLVNEDFVLDDESEDKVLCVLR